MNKSCEFFLWHWLLIFSVMLLILGSLLIAFAQAPDTNCIPALEDNVGMEVIGALFVVAALILLLTAPCTYSNMRYVWHWVDHCYHGKCFQVVEEARGNACADGDNCWIYQKYPWKIVCFCALFSDWTIHIHKHVRHSGCEDDNCWIRRLTACLCCCCRGRRQQAAGESCCPVQVVFCMCSHDPDNRVHPVDDNNVHPVVIQQGTDQCVICMDAPKRMAFQPCGHNATCSECAQLLIDSGETCPICRGRIDTVIRIYN